MKKRLTALALAATSIFSVSSFAASPVELTVYTAFESDLLTRYKKAFEQENPDIRIKWVRDSTGIMTAKLLAEKANNRADVVWGLAGSSMALLKQEGVLDNYKPAGLTEIKAELVDPEASKAWFGNQAFFNVVCYNEAVAKAKNLPKPESWQDLLDPVYRGQIAMPNPASSGTGYMQVSAWLQSMGEDKGWSYMAKLNNNIAQYTHSGSKPCVQAAMGEVAIGISQAIRGAQLKTQGAPLDLILPEGGIGWDVESVGLVAGTPKAAAAKKLVDWSLSQQANEQYVQAYAVVGHKDVSKEVPNYPDVESAMVEMDFNQMASERKAVLSEWSKRFDHKSEPKS
ncbi:putative 2-aminoethylphosphonate ABC transporter substrate-binding protein [Endozoicomonas arenosclerae]|uniref:putative 2-aminoethylphosphonate ABC transporter substrate-binding protein n=1 Tax=Endozoicomonas arenosclerae TaxID=1633495 RepID=UPI0007837F93|nr:putative 2-aminoethylphosphonate ABC transporter substrate-binding protein [Endozoicomonas arenosclerae]